MSDDIRLRNPTLKQYRLFKKNPLVLLPCNPRRNFPRVFLGLHGDSTEGFLLNNLYCLK